MMCVHVCVEGRGRGRGGGGDGEGGEGGGRDRWVGTFNIDSILFFL